METFINLLVAVHVTAGFVGLGAFWVPVFAKKGAVNHRRFGKLFKFCAYLLLGSALLSIFVKVLGALWQGETPAQDPDSFAFALFLGYLAIVTFIAIRHGLAVLEHKADLRGMNTPMNRGLAWTSIAASLSLLLFALAYSPQNAILLYALSPVGLSTGYDILKLIRAPATSGKAWFYEHMGALLGAGVAFHTAFAVFGSGQLFDLGLEGLVAIIPWVAPAAIGLPATAIWTRHYKRKFGELAA